MYCILNPAELKWSRLKNTRKNGRALGIEYVLPKVDYATTKAKEIIDMVWREDRTLGKWKKRIDTQAAAKKQSEKIQKVPWIHVAMEGNTGQNCY